MTGKNTNGSDIETAADEVLQKAERTPLPQDLQAAEEYLEQTDSDLEKLSKEELTGLLKYHNQLYWQKNSPVISDARYDEITRALQKIDPENPLLLEIHTPQVTGSGKVRHIEPMLSLDKAYTLEELLEWGEKFARDKNEKILIEPKYDGISANFDGKILATRGDGEFGENISDKLPLIELETTEYTGPLNRPARGELLIREDDFKKLYADIRKKDGGTYKNSRNAVAGIVGLKDISLMLAQKAKITLVDYSLFKREIPLCRLQDEWEKVKEELAALPYPQDGIVLKFADEEFRKSLGNTVHHPRGEIAYKFTNESRDTVLLDVEWSSGKNCLTPVAVFEPIEISGTTITRATLHNAENVLTLGVQIGDTITVERAGDVIPHIISSRPGSSRKDPMISTCPQCAAQLARKGPELYCPNPDCPGTVLQQLAAAVRCFGIENLGEGTLIKLIRRGLVRHVRDLFDLTAADLLRIDGFASKSVSNLLQELQRAKRVNDYQLLAALNIPGIGINIARQLLAETTLGELRQMTAEELAAFPGIGPERAVALTTEFAAQREYLDELLDAVTLIHAENASASAPGICFTGKMPEKRSYYEKLAEQKGFAPTGDVTKELALLVAADVSASGGKLDKARKYGVKIISLEEFLSQPETEGPLSAPAAQEPDDARQETEQLFLNIPDEEPEKKADEPQIFQGELF